MSGGARAKSIGMGLEYSLRNHLRERGYQSERVPLSGASVQLRTAVALHDVYGRKTFTAPVDPLNPSGPVSTSSLFLQIECKKSSNPKTDKGDTRYLNMQLKKWIHGRIDFNNDELLVFAFARSELFALISEERFNVINKTPYRPEVEVEVPGESIFKLYHTVAKKYPLLKCPAMGCNYVILSLDHFLDLRERYQEDLVFENKIEAPNPIEFIKKVDDVQKLLDFDKNNKLSYMEKRVLYSKLERIEAGQTIIDPSFINENQFWLKEEDKPLILKLSPEERAAIEVEAELRNISVTDLLLKLLRSFLKVQIEKRQAEPNV